MTAFTRRNMLTAAAASAATAASTSALPAPAVAAEAADLELFVTLSAALTGIDASRLAPGVDPVQIKKQYFRQASIDPAFPALLQIARETPGPAMAAAVMDNTDAAIKYLGRSIILAWYTGAWYAPNTLQMYNSPKPPLSPLGPEKVISGTAYTQGWTWRVAQTHPMGYSEWRFGYWSENPPTLDQFIRKIP